MLQANELSRAQVVSLILTATPDLRSEFPARGARESGWDGIPTICAVEIEVPGALPKCIRALVHVEMPPEHVPRHTYLRNADVLRPDLS
jgi:chorismate mutase